MPNNPHAVDNLKPFVKGDARINRKGRPRSFDQLRKLAIKIANEEIVDEKDKEDTITRIENLLRAYSNPRHPKSDKFLEYAYGKVPDKLEVETNTIKVKLVNDDSRD